MSSEPIELTDAEKAAAAAATQQAVNWGYRKFAVVDLILDAVNRVRAGDPVGTIRRSPDSNEIAVSRGSHLWWLHNLDVDIVPRGIRHDPVIPSWPVVYSPDGAA